VDPSNHEDLVEQPESSASACARCARLGGGRRLCALPGAQAQASGPAPAPPFNIEVWRYPCPEANNASATNAVLRGAMACVTNRIRCLNGRRPLTAISLSTRPPTASSCDPSGYSVTLGYVPVAAVDQTPLGRAAQAKAQRILQCQQFSHTPCGDDPWRYVTEVGYRPNACMVRENLYVASPAGASTAQRAADSWFNESPDSTGKRGHRDNMLATDVYETGVGVARGFLPASIFGRTGAPFETQVWVQLYGAKTC
jgi:hypothetical protein